MAWTNITLPDQGKPTRRSLLSAIIDNFAYLYAAVTGSVAATTGIANPSFEQDTDANNTPDNWTWSGFTGGTKLVDDTEHAHGAKSFKVTSPGGVGQGGGTLTMDDFFEVSPQRPFLLGIQMKSSVATIKNIVEILWYDEDQVSVSTTTLFSEDTNNPTDWRLYFFHCAPPSTARYAKIRLTGCDNTNTTAGSVWFDDLTIRSYEFTRRVKFETAGNFTFTAPVTAVAKFTLTGGGGGAGNSNGGGGGGGEVVTEYRPIVAGTEYDITVGAGGAAGGPGTAGGDSTFETAEIVAKGGSGGAAGTGSGLGGAGGTGGTGDIKQAGETGHNGTTASPAGNNKGGDSYGGGRGGPGTGVAGAAPGGGGGGNSGGAGAAGAVGSVIIEF